MDNNKAHITKRVIIKFKNSAETIEGNMVFENKPDDAWEQTRRFTWFTFRFNNDAKTEKAFNMIDVDTIQYLQPS